MLIRKKHECFEADDGLIALNMIRDLGKNLHYYDAILMDYMMPNMDGPTATSEIRKLGYTRPIIGVTGHALKGDQEQFMACGVTCIFTKPVDIKQIQKVFYDGMFVLRMLCRVCNQIVCCCVTQKYGFTILLTQTSNWNHSSNSSS